MIAEAAGLAQIVDVAEMEQVRHHGDEHPNGARLLAIAS
jgi:hypothetical protein